MIRRRKPKLHTPKVKLPIKHLRIPLIALLLILLIISIPRLLPIKSVICESQYGPCSETISKLLKQAENRSYNTSKITIANIFSKNVLSKKYSVKFEIPSTLHVYVVERKPVVALTLKTDTAKFFLVDQEGYIIRIQENNQLPVIIIDKDTQYAIGNKVGDDIIFAKDILDESFKMLGAKLANLTNQSLEVDLPSGIKAVFPLEGDLDVLFGSLTLILSRLNTNEVNSRIELTGNKIPERVDLRFKNPVIQFK